MLPPFFPVLRNNCYYYSGSTEYCSRCAWKLEGVSNQYPLPLSWLAPSRRPGKFTVVQCARPSCRDQHWTFFNLTAPVHEEQITVVKRGWTVVLYCDSRLPCPGPLLLFCSVPPWRKKGPFFLFDRTPTRRGTVKNARTARHATSRLGHLEMVAFFTDFYYLILIVAFIVFYIFQLYLVIKTNHNKI
jgi:hypothetical protein